MTPIHISNGIESIQRYRLVVLGRESFVDPEKKQSRPESVTELGSIIIEHGL